MQNEVIHKTRVDWKANGCFGMQIYGSPLVKRRNTENAGPTQLHRRGDKVDLPMSHEML